MDLGRHSNIWFITKSGMTQCVLSHIYHKPFGIPASNQCAKCLHIKAFTVAKRTHTEIDLKCTTEGCGNVEHFSSPEGLKPFNKALANGPFQWYMKYVAF